MFKRIILGCLMGLLFLPVCIFASNEEKPVLIRVFHLPTCKACVTVIHDVIPPIANKYGAKLKWEYIDISDEENYKLFLRVEKKVAKELASPTVLIGKKALVGLTENADLLEKTIDEELASPSEPLSLEGESVNLLERFQSFGAFTVIGAGLIDGINPCAFTVIVFFVSFLTFMGYRRREMALIGAGYIFAVFLTYLAIGLGFFKALYSLKFFHLISKAVYLSIGILSIFLGILAIRDYILYKKTGKADDMSLQLPRVIKNKIHAIVGEYYRKDKDAKQRAPLGLLGSAFVVGFMISLLEAVCTGQLYLPTIIFVLKEGSLRAKALSYLFLYNFMFIVPLVAVLVLALAGVTSKHFESFAKKNLGVIKLAMAAVFLALGLFLLSGM